VRVIAGSAKGTRLAAVPGDTRPLADRAREGLFSSVGHAVVGCRFLDLFAGTGAVAIEALSRGAASATLVDSSPTAIRAIRENLRRSHLEDPATVLRADAGRSLASLRGPFDVVFLDPPYAIAPRVLDAVVAGIASNAVAAPGGLVILTRPDGGYIPVIPIDWAADRRLSYGDAVILAYRVAGSHA
jgi:16S rRNA (guanine966-N2)-methyltransferase